MGARLTSAVLLALVLGACSSNAQQGLDTTSEATLQAAAVTAQTQYEIRLSFAGFDAALAGSTNPGIKWSDGGPPTQGQVSIRDDTSSGMVLVTRSTSGDVLCVAVTGKGLTMGTQDAKTLADCTGGWPS